MIKAIYIRINILGRFPRNIHFVAVPMVGIPEVFFVLTPIFRFIPIVTPRSQNDHPLISLYEHIVLDPR